MGLDSVHSVNVRQKSNIHTFIHTDVHISKKKHVSEDRIAWIEMLSASVNSLECGDVKDKL